MILKCSFIIFMIKLKRAFNEKLNEGPTSRD